MRQSARIVYAGIGFACIALGMVGAVLPVLPTTPFLILALWAFSRSSTRLEAWLLAHHRFGPRLIAWRAYRAVPLGVKLTAWGSMLASLALMLVVGAPPLALGGAAALMAIGAIYVARCPSRAPSDEPPSGAP